MPKRFKYPRTPHLPWSVCKMRADDQLLKDTKIFEGKKVVVTEKLDGENTSMYSDYIHARSIDYKHHPSRSWVKNLHSNIAHLIPDGWRLCGENLYAKHSIYYEDLRSYFYLFSIWDENNSCLSWEQTLQWAALLGLETPRVFFSGLWSEEAIRELFIDTSVCEGYVVRVASSFNYEDFQQSIAKLVREQHIQTTQNWKNQKIIPNQLKESEASQEDF